MPDAHANFAYSTVTTAPSPATSGLSLVVAGGTWPATPFNATVHAAGATEAQIASGAEIIRVTGNASGTFTITRAAEGPNAARAIVVGDVIKAGETAKSLTDIEAAIPSFATNAVLLGSSAAAGAATTVMRSNDTIAAFDATSPTTQAFGDAAAVGTAAFAARRDHKHAMPASPLVALYDSGVLGGTAASIDSGAGGFSTAYSVLEIFLYLRTDEAATVASTCNITFNNDTGSNYDRTGVQTLNTTVSGFSNLAAASFQITVPGASVAASFFSSRKLTIPNYGSTVAYKAGFTEGGFSDTTIANARISNAYFNYRSTSAISRVKVAPNTGAVNFIAGSRMIVYGKL